MSDRVIPYFTLGDRLRRCRMDAGLESGELAELLYINQNTLGSWENDRIRPRALKLRHWAEVIAAHSDYEVDGLLGFLSEVDDKGAMAS